MEFWLRSSKVWCSYEHMQERFIFLIQPLSPEEGFELTCDGLLDAPLHLERLFEAVVLATQFGQGLDFEIQILDVLGSIAEVIELRRHAVLAN